ncbi:hypothetical protein IAT38_001255 [Cryptococcus sp. DSM 104549]
MRLSVAVFTLAPLLQLVSAITLSGRIAFSELLPYEALPPTSQVSLDHGLRKAWVKQDGSFELPNVPEGVHHVETLVPGYFFQPLIVTVTPSTPTPESSDTLTTEPINTIPSYSIHVQASFPSRQPLPVSSPSLPNPLVVQPLAKEDYFIPKGGMNVMGLLKNPMVLMMVFSGVMLYGLPKIMANMDVDPEMAKEMAETRQRMQGMQNMDWAGSLSNMLSGGSEEAPRPAAAAIAPTQASTGAGGGGQGRNGGGGKKRKGR